MKPCWDWSRWFIGPHKSASGISFTMRRLDMRGLGLIGRWLIQRDERRWMP
jgi:hypothetical protein